LWDEDPWIEGTGVNSDIGVRLEMEHIVVWRMGPLQQMANSLGVRN
jgi:hypothetical protein